MASGFRKVRKRDRDIKLTMIALGSIVSLMLYFFWEAARQVPTEQIVERKKQACSARELDSFTKGAWVLCHPRGEVFVAQ